MTSQHAEECRYPACKLNMCLMLRLSGRLCQDILFRKKNHNTVPLYSFILTFQDFRSLFRGAALATSGRLRFSLGNTVDTVEKRVQLSEFSILSKFQCSSVSSINLPLMQGHLVQAMAIMLRKRAITALHICMECH